MNYLLVFHAMEDPIQGFKDISDDPDFSNPPTWGICRPNIRRTIDVGSVLVFVGVLPSRVYYLKGWFEVGEKIGYVEALERFRARRNVMLSEKSNAKSTVHYIWRVSTKRAITNAGFSTDIPEFLLSVRSQNRVFFQNALDEHEVDNWKCGRIYQCRSRQLLACLKANACMKDGQLEEPKYRNYVVAHPDRWQDVGKRFLKWSAVESSVDLRKPLHTPLGQHNAIRLTDEEVRRIISEVSS